MVGRRDDVLTALRDANEPLSITAIADTLGIHPNTVRFHLDALTRTGQVELVETKHAKPGRPAAMFRAAPGMNPAGPRDYRMLAGILADALARRPAPVRRAVAAGRTWAGHAAEPVTTPRRIQALDRLTELLEEFGFAPEKRSGTTAIDEIGLRSCPFLELAQIHPDVVCSVHLGLMQGALAVWDAPVTVDTLTPFAQPDRCVAHLVPTKKAS